MATMLEAREVAWTGKDVVVFIDPSGEEIVVTVRPDARAMLTAPAPLAKPVNGTDHSQTKGGEPDPEWYCKDCDHQFDTLQGYKIHMGRKHGKKVKGKR